MGVLANHRARKEYKQETARLRSLPLDEIEVSGVQSGILRTLVNAEFVHGTGMSLDMLHINFEINSSLSHDALMREARQLRRLGLVSQPFVTSPDTFALTPKGRELAKVRR